MKQRIRVTAICERDGKVLLLKRAAGRVEGMDNYELPTGKIIFGEQPDEAMSRVMYENLAVEAQEIRLEDVVTFTNLVHASELANLFIVYRSSFEGVDIKLNNERHAAYQWCELSELDKLTLDEASSMVLQIMHERAHPGEAVKELRAKTEGNLTEDGVVTIYTDGGSRGNPGPSGLGYYIVDQHGEEVKRGGVFLGMSNSRLAEYYGLKEGVEQAIELGYKKVNFVSDCLMMVNQMNGVYQVKNKDLLQVYNDILKLLENLESFSFKHVPRYKNQEADAEVNRVIDANIARS
ncbi:reverse transcriptase-like protein [Candidatus Saccharibacteria bacterium]|nr:reverse transcriptase-like protein [Candidatus Saccharibacteria bacterium]